MSRRYRYETMLKAAKRQTVKAEREIDKVKRLQSMTGERCVLCGLNEITLRLGTMGVCAPCSKSRIH
ncbi:MAG: hypothetical protein A2Y38_24580 [Spirochaetes bacterium GWB1_59_5]|nr:MAG: hypothetical protein A2Y38_24580 [Spirochaetes bacterium GWB1_59_5]